MIWNLEPAKLRSRERAMILNLEPVKLRSCGLVKTGSHEPAEPRTSGVCEIRESPKGQVQESWRTKISRKRGDSRTSRKQSQRRHLRTSVFSIWTSGRLVNVWDLKDIRVCVHTRNILWVQGYFRNVKVPSSPYKRGCEGTCKRTHNFWDFSSLWGDSLSPLASLLYSNVLTVLSLVFEDLVWIFGYPPTLVPTVF
jgi:hypothetical protein